MTVHITQTSWSGRSHKTCTDVIPTANLVIRLSVWLLLPTQFPVQARRLPELNVKITSGQNVTLCMYNTDGWWSVIIQGWCGVIRGIDSMHSRHVPRILSLLAKSLRDIGHYQWVKDFTTWQNQGTICVSSIRSETICFTKAYELPWVSQCSLYLWSFYLFTFMYLGIEPRELCLLGKCSPHRLYPQTFLSCLIFLYWPHWTAGSKFDIEIFLETKILTYWNNVGWTWTRITWVKSCLCMPSSKFYELFSCIPLVNYINSLTVHFFNHKN
jgi:hypothetical protein